MDTSQAEATPLGERAQDVVALLEGEKAPEDVFGPTFLAAVSPAQFNAISSQLTTQFGPVIGVESLEATGEYSANIALRFERAIGRGTIALESQAPYRVEGLLLSSFESLDDTPDKISAELNAMPGNASAYFGPLDGSDPMFASNPDEHMAIGSTFKLYVLSALARSIEAGERNWADTVAINRRSFPSGQMQDWPEGAPVTLQTLATMMISISDNTATDILIHELGREVVEAELIASGHSNPARTLPLLTTIEMFGLKGSPYNLEKYINGDEAAKRFMLLDFVDDIGGDTDKLEGPIPTVPTAIDTVEWFANAGDLAGILNRLSMLEDGTALSVMAVNPALDKSQREKWKYVGFKGGSEPGVLNLTWLLQDQANAWHILTVSANNQEGPINKGKLQLMAQRILALAP
ncbi:serine hydrolase [Qipengyuania sp. DGS5-3]|uniref:serine hydrolase n=1 Tax=Qipengyuania sp. DGS5-3 TaxID=3349632 RepID=UPI0036D2C3BE